MTGFMPILGGKKKKKKRWIQLIKNATVVVLCPAQKITALPRNHGTVALYRRAIQTSLSIIIKIVDVSRVGGGMCE